MVLTGAGISAESGISTFRDKDGLWAKVDLAEVATPDAFARNPAKVQDFYNRRRRAVLAAKPNAAHTALARLERDWPKRVPCGEVLLVTQNVDPLHERAGSKNFIHMHGELLSAWCTWCDRKHAWEQDLSAATPCPSCANAGGMRPDIVWFGELPYDLDMIDIGLQSADLFVSIGTSGHVYPAASFVAEARREGAHTVELNLEPSAGASSFHTRHHGPASVIVPAFVDRLLATGQT